MIPQEGNKEDILRLVDKRVDELIEEFIRSGGAVNPIGVETIDKVLRPFAQVLTGAHLDKRDPDTMAHAVEMATAYMIGALLRHTLPINGKDAAVEIAGDVMNNIADLVSQDIDKQFTQPKPKVILPN